ncbi:carbohydrate ABC transporter substrate-binding protein [Oculatella sp. FACHB-28]|uniref:ABC transporter substrate-binding protein n=1 Tax=Oculatella sp. FACHB-28 TaxID=2692845 RepID=UPI001682F2FE|nr:ABC transporter substrate-binding protein [Oculatella sp. FACHB-28]MBD2059198.1 carbohydrate ABC transporter substrate-binding protein [Oculatella sp. FACHB-28]
MNSQAASVSKFLRRKTSRRLRRFYQFTLIALVLSVIIAACTNSEPGAIVTDPPDHNAALTIWWDKGFNLEEDEAIQQVVNDWSKQHNAPVELSFYTADDLSQKAQRALQAGNPPDIMMSNSAGKALIPRLAWQGELADVSDVIEPVQQLYPASVLDSVALYNNTNQKRSYYTVPISQSNIYIFYWRDLIQQAGFQESDIPQDWDTFWAFWQQVQDNLQNQPNQTIHGLGFSYSVASGDTYSMFEHILEAHDVQLLTPNGDLLIENPQTRQGIIDSLRWYTQFYQQRYVPLGSEDWRNSDNNTNLLNRTVVMTPNASLSIPATVRQDTDTYQNKLGILEFPNKPSGQPMRYLDDIRQAIVFADSENQKAAKEFLSYLIQPEAIENYLKAAGGRNLPVMTSILENSFWTNPADPHLSTATKILLEKQSRPFYSIYHPAYSLVVQENVWGQAINRIVVDRVSPGQAADDAIQQIQQIFAQWQ